MKTRPTPLGLRAALDLELQGISAGGKYYMIVAASGSLWDPSSRVLGRNPADEDLSDEWRTFKAKTRSWRHKIGSASERSRMSRIERASEEVTYSRRRKTFIVVRTLYELEEPWLRCGLGSSCTSRLGERKSSEGA